MSWNMRAVCLTAFLGLALAGGARGSEVLVGGENWRFKTDLDIKGAGGDYVGHHSSSVLTTEWRLNKNMSLNLNFGQLTSTFEDEGLGTSVAGDGYLLLAGATIAQELDTGGGLMIDASYSLGWTDLSATKEYDHTRGHLMIAYVFGRGDRSRLFAGVDYNIYESDIVDSAGPDSSYESDGRISVVAGIRAKTDTFVGTAQLYSIGEWGFRLGLSFGF